jgi:hypothetical protein
MGFSPEFEGEAVTRITKRCDGVTSRDYPRGRAYNSTPSDRHGRILPNKLL